MDSSVKSEFCVPIFLLGNTCPMVQSSLLEKATFQLPLFLLLIFFNYLFFPFAQGILKQNVSYRKYQQKIQGNKEENKICPSCWICIVFQEGNLLVSILNLKDMASPLTQQVPFSELILSNNWIMSRENVQRSFLYSYLYNLKTWKQPQGPLGGDYDRLHCGHQRMNQINIYWSEDVNCILLS